MEEAGTMATILVIEEEPQLLRLWRQIFEETGYSVYAARDLAEGLAACQQHPMDLVMIELPTAEGDDLALIQTLRALLPPVKMLVLGGGSPRGAPERLARTRQVGADRAYQKPITRQHCWRRCGTSWQGRKRVAQALQ